MTEKLSKEQPNDLSQGNLHRVRSFIDTCSEIDLRTSNLSTQLFKNSSWEECVTLLESKTHGLFHIATNIIKHKIDTPPFQTSLPDYILSGQTGVVPLLRILGAAEYELPDGVIHSIIQVTGKHSSLIQETAARCIGFKAPSRIPELLAQINPAIANGLCYSGDTQLLEPILNFWKTRTDSSARLPPALGFIVTPQWLANNVDAKPAQVGELAFTFGYIDDRWFTVEDTIPSWVPNAWKIGINYVVKEFEGLDVTELEELQRSSLKRVLPWTSGIYGGATTSTYPQEIVRAGLISAIRTFERENLLDKRQEPPFHPKKRTNVEWARFCHSPASWCRKNLITKPLEEAQKMGVPEHYLDTYLNEYAVLQLELDRETQREAELFFMARWQLVSQSGLKPGPIRDFPVTEANSSSFPDLVRLVLPKIPSDRAIRKSPLSLGARAAASLFEYSDQGPSQKRFYEIEQHQRALLTSIGCEIQVPFSAAREKETLPWKVALRTFGIPSPYRPEYDKIVEGSFAPSWSYLVPIASILALRTLGLFKEEQNVALHISIGAELGDKVKYLLFPQQFITTVLQGRYSPQLLSKGFACLHKDAYSPHQSGMTSSYLGIKPEGEGLIRTEIRSFRIPPQSLLSATGEEGFIEDIIANHLLASAAVSALEPLHTIWVNYCREIDTYVEGLPEIYHSMFHTNWYESTGEPYDKNVMGLLPTFRRVTEGIQHALTSRTFTELQNWFTTIRRDYALQLQSLVGLPLSLTSDPTFYTSTHGFSFLRPTSNHS
jgi:hypothetical protein